MSTFQTMFSDPERVSRYTQSGPPAFAPGHSGLMQMTGVLLAEAVPDDGHVLVVGAGGGLETGYLATRSPGWRFTGVDPSVEMLDLARATAGGAAAGRLTLIEGTVEAAPAGPFDAATLILVLGLIPDDGSKLKTLKGIHQRLKPGAPFILVDQCIDRSAPDFPKRLDRYAAYAKASGVDPQTLAVARQFIETSSTMVVAERNEQLLSEAGFSGAEVFYVGMAWRGWVAYA